LIHLKNTLSDNENNYAFTLPCDKKTLLIAKEWVVANSNTVCKTCAGVGHTSKDCPFVKNFAKHA